MRSSTGCCLAHQPQAYLPYGPPLGHTPRAYPADGAEILCRQPICTRRLFTKCLPELARHTVAQRTGWSRPYRTSEACIASSSGLSPLCNCTHASQD